PDNPIGCGDQVNNWGNLVIIQDPRGFFVELSHFAKDSIKVREGGWVERGDILGRCGNSGYSAQPHIHIQVQASETIGAHTLPFSFIGYLSNGKYHANELPEENHAVEPLLSDDKLDFATSFALDTCLRYEVLRDGEKIDEVRWVVRMSADGTFYFDSGKGKLYFGKHEGTFYLYRHDGSDPYMKILFQALPRLPLTYKPGMLWEDSLTVDSVAGGFQKSLALFLSSFNHDLNRVSAEYRYENRKKLTGNIRSNLWKLSRKTSRIAPTCSHWNLPTGVAGSNVSSARK
ncbi:MAG: M23 family metallopeptidase, partial [Nitrospinae bacterium]|nr:M23 family metallopeptidase [Nitrospinota bacterium]